MATLVLCLQLNIYFCIAENFVPTRTGLDGCLLGEPPRVKRGPYDYVIKGIRCDTGDYLMIAWQ
jgi:hypothetical protein